jgi:hypothetical protein
MRSPAGEPARCHACTAFATGSINAARSQSTSSGRSCSEDCGTTTRSAKPPARCTPSNARLRQSWVCPRVHSSQMPHDTRGFTATRRPSVVWPTNSWPMTRGGTRNPGVWIPWISLPQIPARSTSRTTSPSPATTSGTSKFSTTPRFVNTSAFMSASRPLRISCQWQR